MKKISKIMLIDDDAATNYIHRRVLESSGMVDEIIIMDDAEEALNFLQENEVDSPHLICLDINMPRMDGWEFLDCYNQSPIAKNQKVVLGFLTTSMNPDDEKNALSKDNVRFFQSKPITIDFLKSVVEDYF